MDSADLIPRPYVYRLTHRATGRFYIGFRCKNVRFHRHHSDDLGVRYFTSSREISKHTFSEYDSMLLAEFDTAEEAYWFEQTSIDNSWGDPLLINQRNQKHYDKALILCSHSQRTKDKISAANTGRILSPEHCRHISEALRELTLARNELKLFRKIVEDQEKDLKTMTVWKLIRKRISEWIRP